MQYTITFSERELDLLIASVADQRHAVDAVDEALNYVRDVDGAALSIKRLSAELRELNRRLLALPPDN